MKTRYLIFICVLLFLLVGCKSNKKEVVVYTSVDQIYSEPFFAQFEKDTGIKVLANYDVEASKTTGLVNKLIAEKENPIADVFWNGEFSQTIRLKEEGILQPYVSPSAEHIPSKYKDTEGYWTAFGGRARVLIINTDLVQESEYPSSVYDLLNEAKSLNAAIANLCLVQLQPMQRHFMHTSDRMKRNSITIQYYIVIHESWMVIL